MIDNVKYPVFSEGISEVLQRASMNANQVAKRLGEDPALIHKVVKGKQSASARILSLLLTLPELVEAGLTKENMNTWKARDKFPEILGGQMRKTPEDEALEIEQRYDPVSVRLAFQKMAEENPELLKEFLKTKMHLYEQVQQIDDEARKNKKD